MSVVILDRDGVINQDSAEYIKSADEWLPLAGSLDGIKIISEKGYRVFVATNQAGIGRGLFETSALEAMHKKMCSLVEQAGGKITGIHYCPHHPDDGCRCRKPGTGLLEAIAEKSGEDLRGQPFVGDSVKDIQAAQSMGCRPILVLTGNGLNTQAKLGSDQVETFDDLYQFALSLPAI